MILYYLKSPLKCIDFHNFITVYFITAASPAPTPARVCASLWAFCPNLAVQQNFPLLPLSMLSVTIDLINIIKSMVITYKTSMGVFVLNIGTISSTVQHSIIFVFALSKMKDAENSFANSIT